MDVDTAPDTAPEPVRRVRALMRAEKDGLLTYAGFTEPDRYEIVVATQHLSIRGDQAERAVEALRALATASRIDHESGEAGGGRLGGVLAATDEGVVVQLAGATYRQLHNAAFVPFADVGPWARGYAAAALGVGLEHEGTDGSAQIREVLTRPRIADRCRLHLRALMEPGVVEPDGVTIVELARRVGHTAKTVGQALRFGAWLSMDMADKMIAALGRHWLVSSHDGQEDREVPEHEQVPEPDGIRKLRLLLGAAEAGWLRYIAPDNPSTACTAGRYAVAVGPRTYTVTTAEVRAWVAGIEAHHISRGEMRGGFPR